MHLQQHHQQYLFQFLDHKFFILLSIILPAREAEVLLRLCREAGKTVNSSALLKELWGDDNYFNLRSLNVYITRLRNHLRSDNSVEIESIRGIGYKLKC